MQTEHCCYIFSLNLQRNMAKKWKDREKEWKNMANKWKDTHLLMFECVPYISLLLFQNQPRCSLLFVSTLQPSLCVILKDQSVKTNKKPKHLQPKKCMLASLLKMSLLVSGLFKALIPTIHTLYFSCPADKKQLHREVL